MDMALAHPSARKEESGLSYSMHVRSRAQRAIATLLMICCGLFASFEMRIADVHDGHSEASAGLTTWDAGRGTEGPVAAESSGNGGDPTIPAARESYLFWP